MAGTMKTVQNNQHMENMVSMKSGLDGRNNALNERLGKVYKDIVSMKSGLDGRNNPSEVRIHEVSIHVSMKSGLDGRNNRLD